jgi:hypothetical protein
LKNKNLNIKSTIIALEKVLLKKISKSINKKINNNLILKKIKQKFKNKEELLKMYKYFLIKYLELSLNKLKY